MHFLISSPHLVRLGEYNKRETIDCQGKLCNEEGVQNIEVGKVKPHPGYKPAPDWMNDICLLGLKIPVKFTSKMVYSGLIIIPNNTRDS